MFFLVTLGKGGGSEVGVTFAFFIPDMADRQSQHKSESNSVCPGTTNSRPVCVLLLGKFGIKSVRKFNHKVFFNFRKAIGLWRNSETVSI